MTKKQPISRRERPAKAALTRAGIVEVALRVMRDEGLERVTMRRIATELDTGPASLYVYVDNTAELHGAILDELLATLDLPTTITARDWRDATITVLVDYTELLFANPSLARSVLTLRPSGPHYLALVDMLLRALEVGKVSIRQAAWGVDLLLQHATATAAEHGTREETVEATREETALEATVAAVDADRYPGIAWASGELFTGEGHQRLDWALRTLLAGISDASTEME